MQQFSQPAGSLYSIGEALLLFLEALPEPVIPYKFHQRCHDASNNYVLCKQVSKSGIFCPLV